MSEQEDSMISVIVCTRNRSRAITGCLDSVKHSLSNALPVEAEIIVVDNASTDNTTALVRSWAEACPFPLLLLYEPKKGLAAARNCGVDAASGDLLVFTDDDCRLSTTYIQDALRYDAMDAEPVFRGGRIELGDPSDLPLTIKTDAERQRWTPDNPSNRHEMIAGKTISGCNMVMRRLMMERVGAFDEDLGAGTSIPGGEDTDYILRAYLAGFATEYVPDMVVFHYHGRKQAAEGRQLIKNYIISNGALYAKYLFIAPALCHELYWDIKKVIAEIASCRNTFLPDLDFSYKTKFGYLLLGVIRYYSLSIRTP